MFRRQTDEVFTTLQQVQRRLSQHTEAGTPDAVVSPSVRRVSRPGDAPRSAAPGSTPATTTAKGRPPPRSTPPPARTSQYGSKFRINDSGSEQPQHVVPVVDRSRIGRTAAELPAVEDMAEPVTAVRPRGLLLTPALALMLAVLFVASVVGAYALGSSGPQPSAGGLGPAPGEAGSRDAQTIAQQREQQREQSTTRTTASVPIGTTPRSAPAVQPRGDHVLVLESLPRYSAPAAERFQAVADRYNEMAREFAADGYQPWFGVRRPSSGGLQLVFGALADDVFGVPDNDALAQKMFTDLRAARFPTAFWVKIR